MGDSEQPARETRRDVPPGGTTPGSTGGTTTGSTGGTTPGPTDGAATSPDDTSAPAAATRTRRDAPSEPAAHSSLVRLPERLADRFTLIGELPAKGAESDLLHVRDASGAERVIKIFRAGFTADRDVWHKLPDLDATQIVRIYETGHAGGRDYEVMEYVPGGNLRALTPPAAPALPPARVVEVVAQLAAGLRRLHEAGIVHRDLKPENVLVRAADPARLAITDFGLSRAIEQSVVFASSSRTLAYAAPESLSGQISPARDWWSLGLIARELLTGRPPFGGLSEAAVLDHLATRPVDVADIADPRLRLLCQGLLVRDPRRRWGADEVGRWMDGASPPVPEDHAPAGGSAGAAGPGGATGRGLPFAGRLHTDRRELANVLVERWAEAARYFFPATRAAHGPSEAWRTLRDWLGGFESDPEGRIELIDSYLSGDAPPDVKLLHLVRWLDPDLPPHYLGHRTDIDDLAGFAGLAARPEHPDHTTAVRIGRHLWDHRLLPVLAGFSGGYALTEIDERWRGLVTAWNRVASAVRPRLDGTGARLPDAGAHGQGEQYGRDEPPVILLTLLALAAHPAETARELAAAATRARRAVDGSVPWFDQVADQAGDDPLRLLVVVSVAPAAVSQAEAAVRRRDAAARKAADQRLRWEENERLRLAGRKGALVRAFLWSLPLAIIWLGGTWLVLQISSGVGGQQISGVATSINATPGLVMCGFAWLTHTASEVFLAWRQGGDYLRTGPWPVLANVLRRAGKGLSGASRAVSRSARGFAGLRGCGCMAAVVLLPVMLLLAVAATFLALAWMVWLTVLAVVPLVHAVIAGIRLHRWRQTHGQAARAATEER